MLDPVSLLPLRDHKRSSRGLGDGCYGACRLERDSGCDFSDQDEGSQGLREMSEKEIVSRVDRDALHLSTLARYDRWILGTHSSELDPTVATSASTEDGASGTVWQDVVVDTP
jgi:hypothetical protein